MSRPIEASRDIARIATVSAHGDESVGELFAQAVEKVGREGLIHIEQGTALQTKLEIAEGVEIDRGFSSGYFVNDMERLVVRLDEPYILVCQSKITRIEPLIPILEKVKNRGLGLSFCKVAIEAHGGAIWIEDAAPGATFCLRFPP